MFIRHIFPERGWDRMARLRVSAVLSRTGCGRDARTIAGETLRLRSGQALALRNAGEGARATRNHPWRLLRSNTCGGCEAGRRGI